MKIERKTIFLKNIKSDISLSEHLLLLCQILDATTECEVLESELTDVA